MSREDFIFKGIATAIITPFKKDGTIDYEAYGRLIDRQISTGVSALVICATTGESSTLSDSERLKCTEFALKRVDGRLPIIVGSGSNCTSKAVMLSREASRLGCDGLLVVTPYYNKASPEGLIRHYTAVADEVDKPIILYNVPSRTGVDIPPDVYAKLSEHENIVAVKEASGSLQKAKMILNVCKGRLKVYSGNDDMIYDMLEAGAYGAISVVSNIVPNETAGICESFFTNEFRAAQAHQKDLNSLISALFCEVNPIPVKYALYLMGLCECEMRLPLCPPSDSSRILIVNALAEHRLIT